MTATQVSVIDFVRENLDGLLTEHGLGRHGRHYVRLTPTNVWQAITVKTRRDRHPLLRVFSLRMEARTNEDWIRYRDTFQIKSPFPLEGHGDRSEDLFTPVVSMPYTAHLFGADPPRSTDLFSFHRDGRDVDVCRDAVRAAFEIDGVAFLERTSHRDASGRVMGPQPPNAGGGAA